MPQPIHESVPTLAEATTGDDSGLLEVEFITPGWGSSGYYSREVVEAAAPLFAPGTHMYFDHPSSSENTDRPERSVRDLAAVIETAGSVNPSTGGIRGKVRPLKAYAELLTDEAFAKNVGVSIRGSATDITVGEAEGRTGPIIEGLADLSSVDFVTRAGRGGRVLSVLESAGVVEATVNDTREQLQNALGQAYGGEDRWTYVRDFNDETVWFQVSADGVERMYGQTYTQADGAVTLTGERTEVRTVTTYVPVTRPGSTTDTTTEESEEDTMAEIKIEESEHRRLLEADGRVSVLENERDTEKARADAAEAQLAERDRADRGRDIIAERAREAGVTFTAREVKGFLADLTVKDDGTLDEAAFTKLVDEDAAAKKAAGGAGTVSGFGGTPVDESSAFTPEVVDNVIGEAFGRTGTQVKEA